MSLPLNCTLLRASGAAYNIDSTGHYTPNQVFKHDPDYKSDPGPIPIMSADTINACLVGQTDDGIIVSFRGTLPIIDKNGWKDWLEDLFAEPVGLQNLPGKVHQGFLNAVTTTLLSVTLAIGRFKPSPTNPIYITGHSKGGGMAPIAAYMLRHANLDIQQVVTFAATKSGDGAFKTGYESVITNHVRYENYGDLVPFLPPADEFSDDLAYIVAKWIPDIGPDLAKWIREAAHWDYTPVGSELYIESREDNYTVILNVNPWEQFYDLLAYLVWNTGKWENALWDAHTLDCNYGYMSGTCPSSVCQ